jgi:GT2 family glycosyltransferase
MLRLENPDLIDNAGDLLSWYGSARKRGQGEPAQAYMQEVEIFSACAGAALYRRSFLAEVGGLDENFISYLEDVDLGLRGRLLGYRCLYAPTAEVLHQGHGAGLPTARYVYLMTRNRLTLLLKNIPARLLLKYSGRLLYGQFYFFLVYKKPLRSLAGTLAALAALPRIWRERQAIQQHRRISDQALETMLSEELGEPSLQELVKSKLTLTFNYFIRKDRA